MTLPNCVFLIGKIFPWDDEEARNLASVEVACTVLVYNIRAHALSVCHELTQAQQEQICAAEKYSTIRLCGHAALDEATKR